MPRKRRKRRPLPRHTLVVEGRLRQLLGDEWIVENTERAPVFRLSPAGLSTVEKDPPPVWKLTHCTGFPVKFLQPGYLALLSAEGPQAATPGGADHQAAGVYFLERGLDAGSTVYDPEEFPGLKLDLSYVLSIPLTIAVAQVTDPAATVGVSESALVELEQWDPSAAALLRSRQADWPAS